MNWKIKKEQILLIVICALISGYFAYLRQKKKNDIYTIENATKYAKEKDYINAINICNKIIAAHPENSAAYNVRGTSSIYTNDTIMALKDINKAIELKPTSPLAYFNKAQLFLVQEKFDRIFEPINNSLKYYENDKEYQNYLMYYMRGIAYYKTDNLSLAIADFNLVINLNSKFSDAYFMKAQILNKMNDKDGCCLNLKISADLGNTAAKEKYDKKCK